MSAFAPSKLRLDQARPSAPRLVPPAASPPGGRAMTSPTVALSGQGISGLVPAGPLVQHGSARAVPAAAARWFDKRQTCRPVHAYRESTLAGRFQEPRAGKRGAAGVCAGKRGAAGVCAGKRGARLLCLFHEPDQSPGWSFARQWQRAQAEEGAAARPRRSP